MTSVLFGGAKFDVRKDRNEGAEYLKIIENVSFEFSRQKVAVSYNQLQSATISYNQLQNQLQISYVRNLEVTLILKISVKLPNKRTE